MFKKLLKNKKAQGTAEYALLISLVVAAVIAMQTYAQRAIQARIRDAAIYMTNQTATLGNSNQYEPYYTTSSYDVYRDSTDTTQHDKSTVSYTQTENRVRSGNQSTTFSAAGVTNGI